MEKYKTTKEEIIEKLGVSLEKHNISNFKEKLLWILNYYGFEFNDNNTIKELREALSQHYEWMNPQITVGEWLDKLKAELEKLNCPIP